MAKLVLPRIGAGMGSVDVINSAFEQLELAFDNTLSRDGTTPNQLTAALDLNGNTLLNAGTSSDPNRMLTYQQMVDYVGGVANGIVVQGQEIQTATAAQTVFNLLEIAYSPGSNNIAVYVDGKRKFSPTDFAESSATRVTFTAGLLVGQEVAFVTNEYLGTVNLPAHTHPWTQVISPPETATRWPTWTEVTGKPATFAPAAHVHAAADITTGRLADARRGVYVQAFQPTGAVTGDLWFY